MGRIYLGACAAFAVLLLYQHTLASGNPEKLGTQAFTINAFASLGLMMSAVVDVFVP